MIWKKLLSFLSAATIILATLPVLVPAPAQAWLPHGTAGACPQATDNGCAAAPANGSFKNASLLTSAQQSGQNSLLPSRGAGLLTLNIPGVDYGIGPDSTLTPTDPRNFNDGVCAWDASAGGRILCQGTGIYHEVLNNIDFCGTKIGKSPAYLFLGSSAGQNPLAGSTVTITNSYFCLAPDLGGTGQGIGFGDGFGGHSNWNVLYKNDQCDGTNADYATTGFCANINDDAVGTTIDIEYSAFTNQNVGRVVGGQTNSSLTMKYNFIQGLNDTAPDFCCNPGNHGEVMSRNCSNSRAGCNGFFDYYEGNFIVWNVPPHAGLDNTTFFISDGAPDGVVYSSVGIVNNIIVTNTGSSGAWTTPDVGLMTTNSVASMGTVTITGNWVDAHGTGTGCTIIGDKVGGAVQASQSGTVINITDTFGRMLNSPVEAGWQFWRGGVRVATITSMGTSTGNTGTVNVNTSATIASDSAWTLVPGYASLTQSGNYNLNDPSHTGTPTAFSITGPAMIGSPCVQ